MEQPKHLKEPEAPIGCGPVVAIATVLTIAAVAAIIWWRRRDPFKEFE